MARAKRTSRSSDRVPVGGNRAKLTVPQYIKDQYKDYVLRWVLDERGNFEAHKQAGYEVVEDNNAEVGEGSVDHARFPGSAIVKSVGQTRESSNGVQVLMAIPREYYEEDQQAKEEEIRERENTMYQKNAGQEGFYESEHRKTRS